MFDLLSVLKLLPTVGPVVAALPEFITIFEKIVSTFKEKDQVTLRAAYVALMKENDDGHKRLQEMLRIAANS